MKRKFRKLLASTLVLTMVASTVPAMSLSALAEETDQWKYIDETDWISEQSGWSGHPTKEGAAIDGSTLTLLNTETGENQAFEHGLGGHAYSEVVYDIKAEGIAAFRAYCGVSVYNENSTPNTSGSVAFQVYGDDELLYDSGVIMAKDGMQDTGEIDLTGYKQLRLVGTDGGNGINQDWVNWCDAMIKIDPAVWEQLSRVEMTVGSSIVEIGEQSKANTVAFRKDNSVIDFAQEGTLTYSSSDENVAAVDENGVITGVSSGIVQITATVELNGLSGTASQMVVVGNGQSETSWAVTSPNETNNIIFTQNERGGVEYLVIAEDKIAMNASETGMNTSLGDFSTGLTFVGREDKEINETYDMVSGKQSTFVNHANETTLKFTKEGIQFNIIARAYDDGVAFQYEIIGEDGQELVFYDENTNFNLPTGSFAYAQPYSTNCYESLYDQMLVSEMNGNYGMDFLYETPDGTWGLIAEARHTTQYTGLMIQTNGSDKLETTFSAQQSGNPSTAAPFVSPWRVVVLNTAEEIANTQIFENLSDPSKIEDTSWIEPGVTNWTWLNGDPVNDGETYKRYIDFAAEMGWTYVLMDEGWNIGGRDYYQFALPNWYEDVYQYAQEKGVKLLAWLAKSTIDTEEKQQNLIPMLAEAGIAGLKIDFFDGDTQGQIQLYESLMEITAENKMLVNFHGSNLPTGERRTWPHILSREGVFGGEYQHPAHNRPPHMDHYNLIPFTRNAVGPVDFTPLYYSWYVSDVASMASTVTFESGIQCLADKPDKYLNSPAKFFFKDLPAAWDNSTVLEADPTEYYTVARQGGDLWYVAGTSTDARTATVDLSFLGEGKYYAFIYTDGGDMRTIEAEIKPVTSEDILYIDCIEASGFGIKILDRAPTQAEEIILSDSELSMEVESQTTITATLNPSDVDISDITWTSSDESVATVNGGTVKALKEGTTVITATTGLDQDVSASCVVTVTKKAYLPTSEWSIRNEFTGAYKINGADSLTIWPQSGDAWGTGFTTRNVFNMAAPTTDFVMTTKVNFAPKVHPETAGLVVYSESNVDALFFVARRLHDGLGGKVIATLNETPTGTEKATVEEHPDQDVYLKLEKNGNQLTGAYRYSEEDEWIVIDGVQVNDSLNVEDLRIGVFTSQGGSPTSDTLYQPATFTEFKVNDEAVPFAYANSYETDLTIEDKVITDAPASTTVAEYADLFDTDAPMVITDVEGNKLGAEDKVGTGSIVTVGTDVLTVVVPGDANGDGEVNISDLIHVKSGILGKVELNNAETMAADINKDNVINILDLVQLKLDILNGNI